MTRPLRAALWGLVLAYVLSVILSALLQPVGTFDEPLPWVGALQILRGVVPHTGFWSTYPPLSYWLFAGVFSLIGETAIAARLLGVVLLLLLLATVACLHRKRFAQYAVIAAALGAGPLFVYAFGVPLAACVCAVLVHFILCRSRLAIALIPGLMLAVTVLMRINFGVYAASAILMDLAIAKQYKRAGLTLGPMLLGFAAYLLPYREGIGEVIYQTVTVPQHVFAQTRFIPLPGEPIYYAAIALPLVWFVAHRLTILPLLAAIAVCALAHVCRSGSSLLPAIALLNVAGIILLDRYVLRPDRTERGLLFLYTLFLHYFLWRADTWHFRPLLLVAGLLLPFGLLQRAKPLIPMLLLVPLAALASWRLHDFRPRFEPAFATLNLIRTGGLFHGTSDTASFVATDAGAPRPEWNRLYPDVDELQALRYVHTRTRENDCVYVGVPHHAAVFVGNIRAYWLLHRCIGVRRFILEPGITTTASAERETIQDLERNYVRWLILGPPEKGDEAFLRNPIPGSAVLDAAIAQHYRVVASFGGYAVLFTSAFPTPALPYPR